MVDIWFISDTHFSHGHTHVNNLPDKRYFNVSVEQLDYTPIHIEELAKRLGKNERDPGKREA